MSDDDLVVYDGRQYRTDSLPEGVKLKDTVPLDEWFASNRTPEHKAVLAPEAATPAKGKPAK